MHFPGYYSKSPLSNILVKREGKGTAFLFPLYLAYKSTWLMLLVVFLFSLHLSLLMHMAHPMHIAMAFAFSHAFSHAVFHHFTFHHHMSHHRTEFLFLFCVQIG